MNRYLKNGIAILCFCCCLGLATSALAGGIAPAQPYFDGFYAGIGAGVVGLTADVDNDYITDMSAPPLRGIDTISHSQDMDLGKHGINGNIFVGFGKTLDDVYYLGGEIFGNLFSPKMKGNSTSAIDNCIGGSIDVNTEVKNPYSFGADIRGGYLIFPRVMLYALIGVDYAKFKVNSESSLIIPWDGNSRIDNNFNKWRLGIMPGIGAEIGLADHVSLRAQYTYTFYSSFDETTEMIDYSNNYYVQSKVKVKPRRSLFALKLSYLF